MRGAGGLPDRQLCSGPGKLTLALGIELSDNGADLRAGPIVISARPAEWRDVQLVADRRIGITKAAELPWRFTAAAAGGCRAGPTRPRYRSAEQLPRRPAPPVDSPGRRRRRSASCRSGWCGVGGGGCRRRRRSGVGRGGRRCRCGRRRAARGRLRRRSAPGSSAPRSESGGRRRRRGRGARRVGVGGVGVGPGGGRRCWCCVPGLGGCSSALICSADSMKVVPDLGRERAARDRPAVELGEHRHQLVGEPDPDGGRELRRPADEPGVALSSVVVPVLPTTSTPLIWADWPVPELDDARAAARGSSRRPRAAASACRCGDADQLALAVALGARALDLARSRSGPCAVRPAPGHRPVAAGGERLVGVRHVQRCDADLEPADDHRVVGRDRRADAHPLGHRARSAWCRRPVTGRAA